MGKWTLLFVYIIVFIVLLINREYFLHWLQNGRHDHIPLMFGLSILFSTIPVIPFTLFVSIMGMKFGVALALFIGWSGGVVSSILYYLYSRYYLSSSLGGFANQYKFVQTFHTLLQRNEFFAILVGRMVPLFPPPLINVYSGCIPIPFFTYTLATAIGKIPYMFVVSYGSAHITNSIRSVIISVISYFIFIVLIFLIYKYWDKKNIALK